MADTKAGKGSTLVYLRQQLTIPGETLSSFGKEWRSLSPEDRAELTEAAQKEMDNA
jgi:ABC-type transporter MlaC component